MTVQEVADLLRVHKMTIYRLIHDEAIGYIKIRGGYRITRAALTKYLDGRWPEVWAEKNEEA